MKQRRQNLFTETERAEREQSGRAMREIAAQFSRIQWDMLRSIHLEIDKPEAVENQESWSSRDCGLTTYESRYSSADVSY